MFLSNASVKRPVAMSCLIIGLVMLGMNSYRKIGLELLPKMDVPYVTIQTVYPGASPSDIEVDVAKKIEDAVSSIDGLKHITSSCMENMCQTMLEFQLEVDVNVAATDVREKLDTILADFPSGVEKPVILKYDINTKPIITLVLTGDLGIDELYDYADNTLSDKMSVIPGVANVELLGGAEREVHILLNRRTLSSANLTSLHVADAVEKGIAAIPSGRIYEKGAEYSVRFDAEYESVREIGSLQVAGHDDARRYIKDLGIVRMGTEERRQACFINGKPCIGIRVVKKSDANAVAVVQAVQKAVDVMSKNMPGGMELIWVTDDGDFIQASVDSTSQSIWQGILLTALILFFFLYNIRSTFVIGITMPLTIVISLFFMKCMNFTLNMSTLLALGLSVGVLVTNSIVVMESVATHLENGEKPWIAARDGTSDVAIAVLASAGTNIVVLFPIGMMGSVVGLFFKPFAWTTLIVNAVSLFISFTLTPILCAFLLKAKEKEESKEERDILTALLATCERWFNALMRSVANFYTGLLKIVGSSKLLCVVVLAFIVFIFIQSLGLGEKVGFTFVPENDRGQLFVKLEYPTYLNMAKTIARVQDVEKKLRDIPHWKYMFTTVGKMDGRLGQISEGVYLAQILLKFPDKTQRKETIHQILAGVRQRLCDYPDCIATVSIPDIVGGDTIPIDMEISGESISNLNGIALAVQKLLLKIGGFISPDTSVRQGKPELRIVPRRPILSDMGISIQNVGSMMRANIEGLKAGTYKRGDRTFDIRIKFLEEEGKRQVNEFQIPVGDGYSVILDSFANIRERKTPVQITRSDKKRIVKVFSQLTPDMPMGTGVNIIEKSIAEKKMLPPGYGYAFRGNYEHMAEAIAEFLEAGILAILLTYLTLAAILESFVRPFLILVTIPLGFIGILYALYIMGESMSIFVLLGAVMLIGIVVNNAILILDHANLLIGKGMSSAQAMLESVRLEFRALLMVTLAAILGMLPLATSDGIGSEMCTGIGIASLGGIAVSAFFTMIVVPLLFMLFAKK